MSSEFINVDELKRMSNDIFISKRSIAEERLKTWVDSIKNDSELLAIVGMDISTISLQTSCPEYYETNPNEELLKNQISELNLLINKTVNKVKTQSEKDIESLTTYLQLESPNTEASSLLNAAKEKWISERSAEERNFNKWKESLLRCDKEMILDKLTYDVESLSFRDEMSSWYTDIPDAKLAEQQLVNLNKKIDEANIVVNELLKKGQELIKEVRSL